MINGNRWYPTSGAGVVRSVNGESGEGAVSALAFNRAAENEVVASPAMIAPLAVAGEGSSKITGSEGGDIVAQPELFHRALEGKNALAQLGQ